MKKYTTTIIISLLIGFFLSYYLIKEYEKVDIVPVFNQREMVYLLQQGVYKSIDEMHANTINLTDYVYSQIEDKYHVYIGISLKEDTINKLKEYFNKQNIKTTVTTSVINNTEFISNLENYDLVIDNTDDEKVIKEVCNKILKEYKEG